MTLSCGQPASRFACRHCSLRQNPGPVSQPALEACGKTPEKSYDPHRIKVGLWAESLRNEGVLAGLQGNYRTLMRELAGIIRRGQETGEVFRDLDPDAVAQVYVSLHEGYTLQRAFDESIHRANYIEAMHALLERGIFHPANSEE